MKFGRIKKLKALFRVNKSYEKTTKDINVMAITSTKTTTGGAIAVLTAIGLLIPSAIAYFDGDPKTVLDFTQVTTGIGMLGAGIASLFARDNSVSDQDAGVRD